jgi:cell division protein FtsI (penicillin-binding protein 3)
MSNPASMVRPWRLALVMGVLGCAAAALGWRALDLQVMNREFLQDQGDARHLRAHVIPAHRGMITDRHGEPLAISTPVDSVWVNPRELQAEESQWPLLARTLGMSAKELAERLRQRADREFMYLKRHVDPDLAASVTALGIPGVFLQREYRRYYPEGEVAAHIVGITDVDDIGREGMELAWNQWLRGTPGSKWVLRDRFGRVVEDVAAIKDAAPGRDLALSIDRRLQYLAYRELKAAVREHQAESASAVILDVRTGEVLAMVNQPSYNPNNRGSIRPGSTRNRAVTDVFEPGSTVKPFTIAAALEEGLYRPDSTINTAPGQYRVGRSVVRDASNYGLIDLTTIIQKSSNVGASKIALSMPAQRLWSTFAAVGFGAPTGTAFPGEVTGVLPHFSRWREVEHATLSFGYGLATTPLQLALAYTVLGDEGRLKPVSFVPTDRPAATRVLEARTAREVMAMMETVVSDRGTGSMARVSGYRVAGKTGTVQMAGETGYDSGDYVAMFAGVAPVSDPRLAMVVVVTRPRGEEYYGGRVAAPVFGRVMSGSLRLLGIVPDGAYGRQWYADAAAPRADGLAPTAVRVVADDGKGVM